MDWPYRELSKLAINKNRPSVVLYTECTQWAKCPSSLGKMPIIMRSDEQLFLWKSCGKVDTMGPAYRRIICPDE